MFTAEQIKAAHSQVKSGADFPKYIQAIKALGVTHYEAYVSDGHIDYHGADQYTAQVAAKYAPMPVAATVNAEEFKTQLRAHQQGQTDYITFIAMCAQTGIEKWEVCLEQMSCTYFDSTGAVVLVEEIPGG